MKNPIYRILTRLTTGITCYALIACIALSFLPTTSPAQETYQLEEMFMDAESWFYFQDYQNSLPLYLRVHEAYPENDNINYKIGFCYLNLEGQESKAIPYLKKATENTTYNFTRESFYEEKAPVDAFFYLGNAYLINNQLSKAIEAYEQFRAKIKNRKSLFRNEDRYDFEFLDKQIESCRTARRMMNEPVSYTAENLGIPINTPQSEFNPVISGDGKTLVFTADKKFYTGVFMSRKKNGNWGPPINLLPQLGIDGDCETTSLSYDGTELYLYREDELDGNLYVSYFRNGKWSQIQKLGENINSKYWESHAHITQDGQKLYFTSNREGGFGDLDIYVSERMENGSWGEAKNLGAPVNTKWREDTPFLTEDGNRLFFSSEGHTNMGGFDLFVSHKLPEGWSSPENMGYPLNTTNDDRFLVPYYNGDYAYYAKFNRNTSGRKDIFRYTLDNLQARDFIKVEGILTYESPDNKEKKDFHINIINTKTQDTLAKLKPDDQSPDIAFKTPTGKNHLIYETPMLKGNKQFIISKDYEIKEQYLQPKKFASTEPEEKTEKPGPEINLDKEVFHAQTSGENLKIKLQLKGGNKLIVNTFKQGELINTEEFDIDKDQFIYEYDPALKESKLTFSLINEDDQIFSKDVRIMMDSPEEGEADKDQKAKLEIESQEYSLSPDSKKIRIRLSVEEGSKLFVETYVNNQLINKEEFEIDQDKFTYEFEPQKEKSELKFKVIDKDNNVQNRDIVISHTPISNNLKALLGSVNQFRREPLRDALSTLDPTTLTSRELLEALFRDTVDQQIEPASLETMLYTQMLLSPDSPAEMLAKLQQLAQGPLKEFLQQLQPNDFESTEELIALLLQGSNEGLFSKNELLQLISSYLADTYKPGELHESLTLISNITLDSILGKLDKETIAAISTSEDLLHYFQQEKAGDHSLIIAFLKGLNLAGDISLIKAPEIPGKIIKEKPAKTSQTIFVTGLALLVGAILIIFLIILLKRRRANNSKS